MTSQTLPFREFWDQGYKRIVPIVPPDAAVSEKSSLFKRPGAKGKAPGVLGRDGLWRGFDWLKHTTTEQDLIDWQAMGAGIGIRTGDGLVALDIDSLEIGISLTAQKLAMDMLGAAPLRVGKAPKALLLYRTAEAVQYQRVEFTGHKGANERIELLCDGRQFVAYGTHPGTGKPYQWKAGPYAYDNLTLVTGQQIDAYFAELARILPAAIRPVETVTSSDRANVNQAKLTGTLELVTRAVSALPNTSALFPTYDDYIRVGAAIKGATQDDPTAGEDLFLEWAGKWTDGDNDPEVTLADYARIKPPFELGAQWLYDHAARLNPQQFSIAELWHEPVADTAPELFPDTPAPATAKRKFELVNFKQARDLSSATFAEPLIKGFLDQGALSVIYGRSNSGKTFVAMDIGFHSATGLPWGGMKTAGLPTLYVAAEGGQGVRKRVAALAKRYPDQVDTVPFSLIMSPIDLFHADADTKPLIEACRELQRITGKPTGFIVIDTLARAMTGGDENSAQDMGMLVRNVDELRSATGAHVMIVHHSGKDASRGARGSNALLGAVDTEIEIADNTISVTKQRDLDTNFSSAFSLDIIPLGSDRDGDLISSCVVNLSPANVVRVGIATPRENDVLEAVATLLALSSDAAKGVALAEIASYLEDKKSGLDTNAVRHHMRNLATKSLVEKVARGKWAIKSVASPYYALHLGEEGEEANVANSSESVASVFQ